MKAIKKNLFEYNFGQDTECTFVPTMVSLARVLSQHFMSGPSKTLMGLKMGPRMGLSAGSIMTQLFTLAQVGRVQFSPALFSLIVFGKKKKK